MTGLKRRLRSLRQRLITSRRVFLSEHRAIAENGLTLPQAFHLAYCRPMGEPDFARLQKSGVRIRDGEAGLLRKLVCALDAANYPTPVSVRFTPAQLLTLDLGKFKLVVDTDDISVSRQIISGGAYEPHVASFLESVLKPGMTALDIGANIGFHAMLMASLVGPAGKVLAFEPNSENCRLILLSLAENRFSHVMLHPVALSASAGHACFSPMLGSNGGFLQDGARTVSHPNCRIVPCQRLDDMVRHPVDLIKIDVEGAEYLALSGGTGLLRRARPIVVAEFSLEMLQRVSGIGGADFLRWMTDLGYRIVLLRRDARPAEDITDIGGFLRDWGSHLRIEDLAFIPA
jgi:FkbM family methyltransferase